MPEYKVTWRAARVNAGYTLKEVANLTDRSIDTIHRYERDSRDIPFDLMGQLLSLYSVPQDMVFCGKESDLIGIRKIIPA
ncbi:helix-turn-helix domain-containing protein [Cohnella sp. 56]|uniref:helix-turn-helix domain-containing protein n=1 Tax=Cohnella sp. 56 TaxID=3113722 RepID=UPI0030EAD376